MRPRSTIVALPGPRVRARDVEPGDDRGLPQVHAAGGDAEIELSGGVDSPGAGTEIDPVQPDFQDLPFAEMPLQPQGQQYFLHMKDVILKGGREQRIYYFARDIRPGAIDALPADRVVVENARTGLPVLKKG